MSQSLEQSLKRNIKRWIIFFIIALTLSGLTAFPIETQLAWIANYLHYFPESLSNWINLVYQGVKESNQNYPFLAYGTDWLAFAHIIIAIAFIGPLRDPVKNIWVIQFGIIACILIIPLALIAGYIREIPFFWRLIDCSFGVFGIIPLIIIHKKIKKLELLNQSA